MPFQLLIGKLFCQFATEAQNNPCTFLPTPEALKEGDSTSLNPSKKELSGL
jgi:hypothetical protein